MQLTLRRATSVLAVAATSAGVGVGVARANTSHGSTFTEGTAVTVTISSAREISRSARKIEISGQIDPVASLSGGAGSIILYRETRSGLQQLSFNGAQTHPKPNGTFSVESTGEPVATNTYVVQYVPSAEGYAQQGVATIHLAVAG